MIYTIYNPATGQILSNIMISNENLTDQNLADKTYVPGRYNSDEYYISNSEAIPFPPKPDNNEYVFDWTTKSWVIDLDYSIVVYRQQRNNLLSAVDRINPVWWNSLTPQQQQELIVYRQALLDVPQQASFPTAVSWPAKPTWL
jgi:hypothetical protein